MGIGPGFKVIRIQKDSPRVDFFFRSVGHHKFPECDEDIRISQRVHLLVGGFSQVWNAECVCSFKERLQLKRCHPHAHELQGESFGCFILLAGARGDICSYLRWIQLLMT